jgi:hypothetical protein
MPWPTARVADFYSDLSLPTASPLPLEEDFGKSHRQFSRAVVRSIAVPSLG